MNFAKFILEHRGPVNMARRATQVLSRFGVNPTRMGRRFDRFMDVLDEYGCRPSFPITAIPMHRNPEFAHRLLERGAELAVHAYTHTDLTTLSYEEQSAHLGKAIELFRQDGVPFSGFRAPYLHWNEDTMRAVEAHRFRYSSNEIVLWDVIDLRQLTESQKQGFENARQFYRPQEAESRIVLPRRRRNFIEIPVSLPDDEILLDRMYVKSADALGGVWQTILERTYENGELFTVQLHPERIDVFAEPLSDLLAICRRRKPGVWMATLDEIARWWNDKSMNSAEFVKAAGGYRARITACKGAHLLLREGERERVIEPAGEILIEGGTRPCVGIDVGSDERAVRMLQDIGYILEVANDGGDHAIHLGRIDAGGDAAIRDIKVRLDRCPGPLLRFGTWPYGHRSALSVTGDIDALTLWDFIRRFQGA